MGKCTGEINLREKREMEETRRIAAVAGGNNRIETYMPVGPSWYHQLADFEGLPLQFYPGIIASKRVKDVTRWFP